MRPLFLLPPETAHRVVFALLRAVMAIPGVATLLRRRLAPADPVLRTEALGLTFPSPVGLAAGFDKDAQGLRALGALGFGFIEAGTVTPRPQPGNPRPRLFRLRRDRALVNRLGFNSGGAEAAARRLARRRGRGAGAAAAEAGPAPPKAVPTPPVVGVNVGKNRDTPAERAVEDYVRAAELLAPHADYLAVNVSSPNTPGLRDLQAVRELRPILEAVRAATPRPVLVKIAPDLSDEDVDAIADLALELGLDGIIATNTTVARAGLATPPDEIEAVGAGGLSGPPLGPRALEVLRRLRARVGDRLVLVAAGGVENPDDAWQRIVAGATLVQVYTGFVYGGPLTAARIARGLAKRARSDGFPRVQDAVATDVAAQPATTTGQRPVPSNP